MLKTFQFRFPSNEGIPRSRMLAIGTLVIGMGAAVPLTIIAREPLRSRSPASKAYVEEDEEETDDVEKTEPMNVADEETDPQEQADLQDAADSPEMNEPDEIPEADDAPKPAKMRQAAKVEEPVEQPVESNEFVNEIVGNGWGVLGRGSHLAGPTFGRNTSITPFEAMPYILTDEHFLFGSARGFVTNRSQVGGNVGAGYRRLFDDWNAWTGASVWFDADRSTGKLYQQVGLSFEGLIQQFEFRSNVYLPVTSAQTVSSASSTPVIVGNQLLFSQAANVGNALRGVDAEVGYSLPVLERHVVRGFVGGYHFDGNSTTVNGFKARVEAVINNTVTAQAMYTNDKLFGSNIMVGVSMQFPFGSNHPTSNWTRNTPSPFRFVERNYNVIVDQAAGTTGDQVATDPATGKPYVVEFVNAPVATPSSTTGPADGTAAHPFSTVAAAQAAGGNVIIVEQGSVLHESIVLTSGQHLFGQGNYTATLPTAGGSVQIPNLMQAAGVMPIIQNSSGSAITLASNSEVAGFNITGSTGNGITGTGVSGVSVHDMVFSSIGGDAIHLTNATGAVNISNTQINSATGNGIVVSGGNPILIFNGAGSTITANGSGFVLDHLTGGSVTLNDLSLKNIGGTGLVMDTVGTDVTLNSLTISQSATKGTGGSAVAITGTTGKTYNFLGNTKITTATGAGYVASSTDAKINVSNLSVTSTASLPAVSLTDASSKVAINNLVVKTQGGVGLSATNASDLNVNGGTFTTVGAAAIDVESSKFNASLSSVSVNGGPFGIKLASSTGNFALGGGSYASGGTIQNTTTAGLLISGFGNASLSGVDFTNNATGIQSTGTTVLTLSNLRINGSSGYAIDSMNDATFLLSNSIFATNGAVGGGTIREQANVMGSYKSVISSNAITASNGNAVEVLSQSGAAGAALNVQATYNNITGNASGSELLGVHWNGPVTAVASNNTLNANVDHITAIKLENSSTAAALTATVSTNSIYFKNATSTSGNAIWIVDGQQGSVSTGVVTLSVQNNGISFSGRDGTGLRFGLYGSSTDTITGNSIADLVGGATGMLFDHVGSNTSLVINTNTITLQAADTTNKRGIIIAEAVPTVTFFTPTGTPTNVIYNAASAQTIFSIPDGTGAGGILINNSYFTPK